MELLTVNFGGLSIHHLLLAFGGGVFGACFGAVGAFVFCGFFVIIGVALTFVGIPDYLMTLGFGNTLGPHVGFAGAVAAAAYAAHKKKIIMDLDTGTQVAAAIEAPGENLATGRDILTPLMGLKRPAVLVVGGVFGIVGSILLYLFQTVITFQWNGMHWTDAVGLTVVCSAMIARLLFGKTGLIGKVAQGDKRYKPKKDAWVPWMQEPLELLVIGLGAGLLSSYMALILGPDHGGGVIGFGLSAISLVFLQTGFKVPVTHHITLIAAGAALASGSVIWGAVFGVAAAFAGQFLACTFCIHGDTHIDPPALTICSMWSLLVFLGSIGLYALIPLP